MLRSGVGAEREADAVPDQVAADAAEVLLSNYPGLTVSRHLRNFHWKLPADIAHYRDGLVKAGIPFSRLTLVEPSPRLAADS